MSDALVKAATEELAEIDTDIDNLRLQRREIANRIAYLIERRKVTARIVRAATPRSQNDSHGSE